MAFDGDDLKFAALLVLAWPVPCQCIPKASLGGGLHRDVADEGCMESDNLKGACLGCCTWGHLPSTTDSQHSPQYSTAALHNNSPPYVAAEHWCLCTTQPSTALHGAALRCGTASHRAAHLGRQCAIDSAILQRFLRH
jgi:hypothetical protein